MVDYVFHVSVDKGAAEFGILVIKVDLLFDQLADGEFLVVIDDGDM